MSSKVSIEPTVEPAIPEPVEFPIKRNDDLDRFKSGPCYIDISKTKGLLDFVNVQMQLIKDRFSLLSFATGNSELALQKLRALKENAAKLNALRKMDKLYGNGKK